MIKKNIKGITLIALVITIIVLLLLAGITITLLLNYGLVDTASSAKQETRGTSVEEIKNIWLMEKKSDNYMGKEESKTLEQLVNELENQQLITEDEKKQILSTGIVTIGTKTIDFLGDDYIRDGLILYFDGIQNTKSGHSQDTLIWEDLSGNGNDGILRYFDNNDQSGWTENTLMFDGHDDGVDLEDKLENLLKDDYTIEIIINFKENNTRDIIIGNYPIENSTNFENYYNDFRIFYNDGKYNNLTKGLLRYRSK